MFLKIGQLAKQTGLTIRTLHHYDELGLLSPSLRSDAGYRLYQQTDIQRLHTILALRQLGMSLSDIGVLLAKQDVALAELIQRQLQMIEIQITQATALRERLNRMQMMLKHGTHPDFDDWLATLELMTMYDKYFTQEEQTEISQRKQDLEASQAAAHSIKQVELAWPELIQYVAQLMQDQVAASDPQAYAAASRWLALVEQFTGSNPNILVKSAQMMHQEPGMQKQTGIHPEMMAYISMAMAEKRLEVYARYLNQQEMTRMRSTYGKMVRNGYL